MVSICVQNASYYVYAIDDWEVLRYRYRIIGELLGSNFCICSLPLKLLPEEIFLLVRKGIAKFVKYPNFSNSFSFDKDSYTEFSDNLFKQEKRLYEDIRKNKIGCNMEKIIYGKRKHGDNRSEEQIVKEELNKLSDINRDTMLWPILSQDIDYDKQVFEVSTQQLLSQTTVSKISIFNDLWEKGYYITTANKFGGDYLLYIGDPIVHHSLNIVHCIKDSHEEYNTRELVCISRLGTSVKKRTLLATVKAGNVSYLTLNWIDI